MTNSLDGKQYLVMGSSPGDNLRQLMVRRQGPVRR